MAWPWAQVLRLGLSIAARALSNIFTKAGLATILARFTSYACRVLFCFFILILLPGSSGPEGRMEENTRSELLPSRNLRLEVTLGAARP